MFFFLVLRGFHWEFLVPLIEWGKKIELNWDILRIIQALPYWVRTVHCASALIVFLDRSEELRVQPYNNTKTHIKSQSWCWCYRETRALLLRAVSREILQEKKQSSHISVPDRSPQRRLSSSENMPCRWTNGRATLCGQEMTSGSCLCKVHRVTTNAIHTAPSLLLWCRQGARAAPLRRDVSAVKQIVNKPTRVLETLRANVTPLPDTPL